MSVPYLIVNWKMHKNHRDLEAYAQALEHHWERLDPSKVRCIILAPFTLLHRAHQLWKAYPLELGAQNLHWSPQGAWTGEISPTQLRDLGLNYALIGHSERRQWLGEEAERIPEKIQGALKAGLCPILCLGESLQERRQGKTRAILEGGLEEALKAVEKGARFQVAYEPLWAIGTGQSAPTDAIQEAHLWLRHKLRKLLGAEGDQVPLLYGGSVQEDNIRSILAIPQVNGVLVGSAGLDPQRLLDLASLASKEAP